MLDDTELVFTKTDGTKYNFNIFVLPLKFVEKFYSYEITLNEAKDKQDKLEKLVFRLNNYTTTTTTKLEEKNSLKLLKLCRRIVSCEGRYYWFF